jgi:hypothetical protein
MELPSQSKSPVAQEACTYATFFPTAVHYLGHRGGCRNPAESSLVRSARDRVRTGSSQTSSRLRPWRWAPPVQACSKQSHRFRVTLSSNEERPALNATSASDARIAFWYGAMDFALAARHSRTSENVSKEAARTYGMQHHLFVSSRRADFSASPAGRSLSARAAMCAKRGRCRPACPGKAPGQGPGGAIRA